VIEPRSSRQSVDETINALLVHTSLETKIPINMTWIGLDGLPDQKGIVEILREWTEFRIGTVRRRTEFRLQKCGERLHIVEGRIIAFAHIDDIIKVIRASEDVPAARAALMARWKFTERQAQDICDLRLGQLTRLDGIKLNEERKRLQAERDEYNRILGSDRVLRALVVKELGEDAKKYGDERRTAIASAERATIERSVVEEPVTVILSGRGWIRARNGHGVDMSAISFKDGDERFMEIECNTTDQEPTGRGDGVPVNTLIASDRDPIRWLGTGRVDSLNLLSTSAGNGFICRLGDMFTRIRAGKEFMTVPEAAEVRPALALWPADAPPKFAAQAMLAALSSDGRLLLFPLADVPTRPNGGLGVQLMALPPGVSLAAVALTDGRELTVVGERRGKRVEDTLRGEVLEQHAGKRAQRGRLVEVRYKVVGLRGSTQ